MGIYFTKAKFKGKWGNNDNIVSLFPSYPQGNKGTGNPWECAGSKGKLGFIIRTAKALAYLHI